MDFTVFTMESIFVRRACEDDFNWGCVIMGGMASWLVENIIQRFHLSLESVYSKGLQTLLVVVLRGPCQFKRPVKFFGFIVDSMDFFRRECKVMKEVRRQAVALHGGYLLSP